MKPAWSEAAAGLSDLPPEVHRRLSQLVPGDIPKGTVLFRPGEAARGFAIVLSGRIDVHLVGPTGREILLYSVAPGQSCVQSTLALLGGEHYSGEAITATPCTVVLIPHDLFLGLMNTCDKFRGFVFRALAARMQGVMHQMERVAFVTVEARLAEALLARAEQGIVHATHQELASTIGSAREVVSRRLDALAARGVLTLDRGAITILDEHRLRELSATM